MSTRRAAIIGSGPAGLMAASVLAQAGVQTTIFEKRRGPAAKLLIAGHSGLNISNSCPTKPLVEHYDAPQRLFANIFKEFSIDAWLTFVQGLGIKIFEGTSHRYFVKGLKAPPLIKAWIKSLKEKNVGFLYGRELTDFSVSAGTVGLEFNRNEKFAFDAVCLCLGGVSWEKPEKFPKWPALLHSKGIDLQEFSPANVGHEVTWSAKFLEEAEGLPLKNIALTSSHGTEFGEVVITHHGLEGTPIYSLKKSETIYLDLKPDLSAEQILKKLGVARENLSALRRAKKYLGLCPAALALLFHQAPPMPVLDIQTLASLIKKFPITLTKKRGLEEAISSAGGVKWSALSDGLMLKQYPGIFVAGEMLDWDAPTGGFLIQACASQGHWAGKAMLDYLSGAL